MGGTSRAKSRVRARRNASLSPSDDEILPDSKHNRAFERNDVSRLSQELEPIHISENRHQDHEDDNDIDPLGQHVKEASAAVGSLEALGLTNLDISIPRCIVLGQQSSGKSSVIEAISGIKTPRDVGTCTCCPLYITLQPSGKPADGWSAKVSLQRDFVPDMRSQSQIDSEPQERFPKWLKAQSSEQIHFAETTSPTELEHLIQRAQAANLSPGKHPASFRASSSLPKGENGTKFSPNVVRIDITQPGLPTLNFFDLPGIFSVAANTEEDYTVPLVRNLVAEYVKLPGTLILLACELSTDRANSTAAALARDHNATDRCIGVLTKPDLVPRGTPDEVLADILDGKQFKLGHKYFVVKNLDKQEIERGVSHRKARKMETEFFSQGRWVDGLRRFQSRFGARNLQMYLSRELAKQTFKSLPKMYQQISDRLADVKTELEGIPETPAHSAVRTVSDILLEFSEAVRYGMEGEHGHTIWWNMWEKIQNAFNDSLEAMKPTLITRGNLDTDLFLSTLPGKSAAESIFIDSEDEQDNQGDIRMQDTPQKKRKREDATPSPSPFKTPAKPPIKSATATPNRGSGSKRQANQTVNRRESLSQPSDLSQYRKNFKLDEVRLHVEKHSKSKVPGEIHPKVRESMMLSAFEKWQIPIDILFSTLEKDLRAYIGQLFHESFQKQEGSELYREAWRIVDHMLDISLSLQKTKMTTDTLNDELEGPYIFYKDQFNRERDAVREMYRQHRQQARFKVLVNEAEQHYDREVSHDEKEKFFKDPKKKAVIAEEPYADEIELMTDIRAYYNIAARRLHDSICMRVESKVFCQLRTELRKELGEKLGIYDGNNGAQTAQRLLAASPEREKHRQDLAANKVALEKGLLILTDLQNKYGGPMNDIEMGDFDNDAVNASFASTPSTEV